MCRCALLRRLQKRAMVRDGVEESPDMLGQCRYCVGADQGSESNVVAIVVIDLFDWMDEIMATG